MRRKRSVYAACPGLQAKKDEHGDFVMDDLITRDSNALYREGELLGRYHARMSTNMAAPTSHVALAMDCTDAGVELLSTVACVYAEGKPAETGWLPVKVTQGHGSRPARFEKNAWPCIDIFKLL